jgi:hypothetical protein
MRENPVQLQESFRAPARLTTWISLGVLCCAGVFSEGCSVVRRKPSVAWGTAIQTRPVLIQGRQTTVDPPDFIPDLHLILPPPPSPIVTAAQPSPVRSRIAATASTGSNGVGKPEVPLIAPQLTVEEATAAKQQTNQSVDIAERNLAATRGKNLGPAQTDLASKVRNFISDARDAARTNDWVRARDLAKKAQVLSEELAKSL